MRLTQDVLREYIELTNAISTMSERLDEIKSAIKATGKETIAIGKYIVSVTRYTQVRPIPVDKIKEKLGPIADQILHPVDATRVQVKKS